MTAPSLDALASEAVAIYRELAGYDRVMFYRFDPDGHGEVMAEAKEAHLEPYLGLHYPESDIPQRARELYLRNRVRVLVDVNYEPVPLVPRLFPPTGEELDMSMSWLRSMSPLHLQYLRNMGVTATLVVSLVREGKLWGLIACHHYTPKRLAYAMRAACDLVAEMLSTRIAVLENFSQVRTTALVRRLGGRLSKRPRRAASGSVHCWTTRASCCAWSAPAARCWCTTVSAHCRRRPVHGRDPLAGATGSRPKPPRRRISPVVAREAPELASRQHGQRRAGGRAVEPDREYLMWLRGEQVREVRWAGNPNKPVLPGNDPRDLSPAPLIRGVDARWFAAPRGLGRQASWAPRAQLARRSAT